MHTLKVRLEERERGYPIYIGRGLLSQLGEVARRHGLPEHVAVIADSTVAELYGEAALSSLRSAGYKAELLTFPPGEGSKTLEAAAGLCDGLLARRLDRRSAIIALGGGVSGDLGGFVAATYLRGIPWAVVPTTLLAQVDAAIGGKTGVDHPRGKNLIGAFHQPRFVLTDPETLSTLPRRELHAGLAEVVKSALIWDEALFRFIEERLAALLSGELAALEGAIAGAARVKAEVVSRDEREGGLRRILNFGHTIAHALEAATGYQHLLHGEAVAWGMLAAVWLSQERGLLASAERARVEALLRRLPRPPLPELSPRELLDCIRHDKKVLGGRLHFVLLRRIGEAVVNTGIGEEALLAAWKYLEDLQRGNP
ncbi:TPA: 3-dehydroquinate synthase [Candidatus Bipolaricaulota bacterium]|nr:3-dehydroquinate synthase [Candidatus Bipolaricaulota bacterium]